jgi:hypothetical protein
MKLVCLLLLAALLAVSGKHRPPPPRRLAEGDWQPIPDGNIGNVFTPLKQPAFYVDSHNAAHLRGSVVNKPSTFDHATGFGGFASLPVTSPTSNYSFPINVMSKTASGALENAMFLVKLNGPNRVVDIDISLPAPDNTTYYLEGVSFPLY